MSAEPIIKEVKHKLAEKLSILDQIKKLDEQKATLLAGAKAEALEKAQAAVAELNELGFSYSLSESGAKAKKTGTRNTDPSKKSCPICETTGHDARAHRGQGKNKKKFTAAELSKLGLG